MQAPDEYDLSCSKGPSGMALDNGFLQSVLEISVCKA